MKRSSFLGYVSALVVACLAGGLLSPVNKATAQAPPEVFRIAVIGQSNAFGWATDLTSIQPTRPYVAGDPVERWEYPPTGFYPSGTRGLLADPTHGGPHLYPITGSGGMGSYWPLVARQLMQLGIPRVEFVFCAKAGSSIGAWRYPPGSTDISCLRGATLALCRSAGPINLVVMHQGEANSTGSTTYTVYRQALGEVAAWIYSDLGAPLMPCLLQQCNPTTYPGLTTINQALQDSMGTGTILVGPDLRHINVTQAGGGDGVHLKTTTHTKQAADAWAPVIYNWWAANH